MHTRALLAALGALGACGDNSLPEGEPLEAAAHLTVVAHQDDDLLFMQPDLIDAVEQRTGLVNIYVTAGNGRGDLDTAQRRYDGLEEAYAEAAGLESLWSCGWIELAGHTAEHCRLAEAGVSLVFLGYPDGGKQGEEPDSLLHLWNGSIASAETIAERPTRYDQAGLIAAVAEVIRISKPSTIRTLEIAATHGRDHADHMIVGALALASVAEAGFTGELLAFRGYAIEGEPANVVDAHYDKAANMLAHYDACATGCATCGSACPTIDKVHATWLRHRYAVGFRRTASGILRLGTQCLAIDSNGVTISDTCTSAQRLELDAEGRLRANGVCVERAADGLLIASTGCGLEPASRFYLDDEGHLWNGAPADPSTVRAFAHAACVVPFDDRAYATSCGSGDAAAWTLTHDAVDLVRPSWLPSSGRAVRVRGDQLFAIVGTELYSARGTDLGFDGPRIHGTLPVAPESLVVGALDEHGLKACGRDPHGVLCGVMGTQQPFTTERWSSSFARPSPGPAGPFDTSLSAFGREICGLSDEGVICAPRGLTAAPNVRSRYPARDRNLWIADLDGDQRADWCSAYSAGIMCGRDAERELTTKGGPWSYSANGMFDLAPSAAFATVMIDIDDDHREDLCMLRGREVVCARSQRFGFGPAFSLGMVPSTRPLTGLWFHGGRACVDDGTQLSCLRVP